MKYWPLGLTSIIISATLSCCKQTAKRTETMVSISQITSNFDSLIYAVKVNGDTNAYDELFYGFVDSNEIERTDSVLRYSKIMAIEFGYEKAYYDHLAALCEKHGLKVNLNPLSNVDLTKQDEKTKKVIIDWLNQMVQHKIITQEEFESVIM